MKKLLNSYFYFAALFAAFYCCAFIIACDAITAFGYYAEELIGYHFYKTTTTAAIFLGAVFFVLLVLSIWLLVKEGKLLAWKSIKARFVTVSICIFLLIILIMYIVRYAGLGLFLSVVVLPLAAYALFIVWLTRLISYLQAGEKYKKVPWYKFYLQFPIKQPISVIVTLLTLAPLTFVLFNINIGTVFLSLLTFTLATILVEYLSRFSETKANQIEKIVAEKMKSERLKTELIANVSHDIKTPLTSIINYADLINKEGADNDVLDGYTSVIHKKSLRLKALIEDLLEASKAATGNIKMNMEKINLCELTGQIIGEYDEQMEEKQLQLISEIPETALNIRADGRHLWRVVENIFSNAVKYSMKGTRIYVELRSTGSLHMLSLKNISNDPLNITADELTEQFVRGDRARNTEGNGLGLYIAKSLTEAMAGQFIIIISGDLFEVQICFAGI